MKKLQSDYPIGQFLIAIFSASGLKLNKFLEAIGYRNTAKGIRHFQDFLRDGLGSDVLINRIMASPYAPCRNAWSFVCQQTIEQLDHEMRLLHSIPHPNKELNFRPFLHAAPLSAEVGSVSMVSLDGEFFPYCVFVKKSVLLLNEKVQNEKVAAIIRQNYHENRGEIDCLGAIGCYLFYRSWWESPTAFSVDGQLLGLADTAFLLKTETARGSRKIDEALMKRLVCSRGYDLVQ